MKNLLYLVPLILAGCGSDTCNCKQLKVQTGIYYLVSPDDEETGVLVATYLNQKDQYAALLRENTNNPLLAGDSLVYYEKQKDTTGMVRQYIKMLCAKEMPERNHAIYEAVSMPGIRTENTSTGLPVAVIFQKAQPLIKYKDSTLNCLFYKALLGCMSPEDYSSITAETYAQNRPSHTYFPKDAETAFHLNKREGHFFLENGERDHALQCYNRALSLSTDLLDRKTSELVKAEGKILALLIDYASGSNESSAFNNIIYNFPLQCELNYMRALYYGRNGQENAQNYFKAAYDKAPDDYLRLVCSMRLNSGTGPESLENLGKQGGLYGNIQKQKKTRSEKYITDHKNIKALYAGVEQLEQKLKEKNIDPYAADAEEFTGSCTNDQGETVMRFESGVPVKE